jgi:hypothetical protein
VIALVSGIAITAGLVALAWLLDFQQERAERWIELDEEGVETVNE